MKTRLFLASALVLSLTAAACGGEQKSAKSPDGASGITETSSTKEDLPPPPAKEGDAPAAPVSAEPAAAAPGVAGGVIKLAALKVTPAKKGKDKAVELKEDGTVSIDGKPAAKIKGDQVDSTGGTSMLTVGIDGSLVGNGVKPGFKFEGDDLVTASGAKLSVGEDGTITSTKDGKSETLAKAEGGASAKRAALVVTVLYLTLPASLTTDSSKATTNATKPAVAKPAKK